ncbi:MAG: amidohydrolase [Synergistaceae bacterium]|nr:amidohydrolase [Synergistaceae bacterium]
MGSTLFLNGRIYTPAGWAEALLTDGQTIAAVGSSGELEDRGAEKVDLGGRLVLPGFIDGHMHFISFALSLEQIDLAGSRSTGEIRDRLRTFIDRERPAPEEWITGRGWNHELFADGRIFEKGDLDDLAPHNPMFLTRGCGHVAVLNSAALNSLGITGETRFAGGVVELDEAGEPTGVLLETAVSWVRSQRPAPDGAKLRRLVARAGKITSAAGLTSVHSDDIGPVQDDWRAIYELYSGLDREGKMPLRVTQQLKLRTREALDDFLASGLRTGDGSPAFHTGPLKIMTDGSLGGRTAFLREEYSDMAGEYGVPIYGFDELCDLAGAAHRAGMQIAMHAIGDGALDMCLDVLEKALEEKSAEARHYIVHCQMGDMDQYRRMARLGIGAAVQPLFAPSDRLMAVKRLGEERARAGYAWKTLLDLGIFMSAGSDSPVESLDPLAGIHAAVTRQDCDGQPEGGWNPGQKLTVKEAVDLYTRGGAYASFEERRKGTLAPGMLADLVVLDRDIFSAAPEEIGEARPVITMMGGRFTHREI